VVGNALPARDELRDREVSTRGQSTQTTQFTSHTPAGTGAETESTHYTADD
jgi:hypothetical protein